MFIHLQRTGRIFRVVFTGLRLHVRGLEVQPRRGVGIQIGSITNPDGLAVENILRGDTNIACQRATVHFTL
ncbi:hypothetical protein D3C80_1268380 [compost metagenome]